MDTINPNEENWTISNKEVLVQDWFFRLQKMRFERSDGKIIDPYYVLDCNHWVNAFAMTRTGQVIMIRQYRHAIGQTILELPGGVMDPGETDPAAAIARELLEETGYRFDHIELLSVNSPNPALQNNWCYSFLAMGGELIQEQDLDDNEDIEVLLMPVEEVERLLSERKIAQVIHVTTLYYALKKLKK
jgi:ADP-ribose pyrophosphatase